jgi:hypothetical protein
MQQAKPCAGQPKLSPSGKLEVCLGPHKFAFRIRKVQTLPVYWMLGLLDARATGCSGYNLIRTVLQIRDHTGNLEPNKDVKRHSCYENQISHDAFGFS